MLFKSLMLPAGFCLGSAWFCLVLSCSNWFCLLLPGSRFFVFVSWLLALVWICLAGFVGLGCLGLLGVACASAFWYLVLGFWFLVLVFLFLVLGS